MERAGGVLFLPKEAALPLFGTPARPLRTCPAAATAMRRPPPAPPPLARPQGALEAGQDSRPRSRILQTLPHPTAPPSSVPGACGLWSYPGSCWALRWLLTPAPGCPFGEIFLLDAPATLWVPGPPGQHHKWLGGVGEQCLGGPPCSLQPLGGGERENLMDGGG